MKFFVLGSHPVLSLAELSTVTEVNPKEINYSGKTALIKDLDISTERLMEKLSGVTKVGSILASFDAFNIDELRAYLSAFGYGYEGKYKFGFSQYQLGDESPVDLLPLAMEVKKELKIQGISSRFVTSKSSDLSSVVVEKNNLIDLGDEFVFVQEGNQIHIGVTEAVQDFEAWSKRDYGRPARDAKSGMLPPKLARLMINLSGTDLHKSTLLDPFCGSGTVLMEAKLLGAERVIGSDISKKAVQDTKKNLSWLRENSDDVGSEDLIVQSDARSLSLDEKVDVVVFEGDLGAPQKGSESQEELNTRMRQLSDLYSESIPHLASLLSENGRMVMALPFFGSNQFVDIDGMLKKTKIDVISYKFDLNLPYSPRGGYLYKRKGQRVGREILVLGK